MDWKSLILAERIRQNNKWGEQNHPNDYWVGILGEEFGEVCKATIEKDEMQLLIELIHVAAVAVQWMDCMERRSEKKEGN